MQKNFLSPLPFSLESGAVLPSLLLAYHTYGSFSPGKKVIWVCHALTANSDVADWWEGLFGLGRLLDPNQYFIVCANMPGSSYGSTSALGLNPETEKPYGKHFPLFTIRDMVAAFQLLRQELEIEKIHLLLGGSMGGQQCLEWAIQDPEDIEHLVVLATNARHSPWGIAFNEAQRMALRLGEEGIKAARAIAMLSYRNYAMYQRTQTPEDDWKTDKFSSAGYQQHQGEKLASRFHADCYYALSKAMDSHNVGRGRGGIEEALEKITAKTLVIGISSDILFPNSEQALLAWSIPDAKLEIINSDYGHDGFLTESVKINKLIRAWLNNPESIGTPLFQSTGISFV